MRYAVEHLHPNTQTWHAWVIVATEALAKRIEMSMILSTGDDGLGYRVTEVE